MEKIADKEQLEKSLKELYSLYKKLDNINDKTILEKRFTDIYQYRKYKEVLNSPEKTCRNAVLDSLTVWITSTGISSLVAGSFLNYQEFGLLKIILAASLVTAPLPIIMYKKELSKIDDIIRTYKKEDVDKFLENSDQIIDEYYALFDNCSKKEITNRLNELKQMIDEYEVTKGLKNVKHYVDSEGNNKFRKYTDTIVYFKK